MYNSPVQQAKINRKKKVVIGVGIAVSGLWLVLIMYFMMGGNKDNYVTHPGIVFVRSASPVATPATPARFSRVTNSPLRHSVAVQTPQWSMLPAANMGSTSGTMHIYQTSSATVHSVGGGGGGGIATTSGGQSSGSRGIRVGGSYGSRLALATSVPMASPGATQAAEVANVAEAAAAPGRDNMHIRRVIDDPFDPFLDPIGDVTWGLMVLLTIGWCVRVRLKGQRACKMDR